MTPEYPFTLGEYLRLGREVHGWRQAQVAEWVGITPQYLSDIEHNRRIPSDVVLDSLARALGSDYDYIYFLANRWPPNLRSKSPTRSRLRQALAFLRGEADAVAIGRGSSGEQ